MIENVFIWLLVLLVVSVVLFVLIRKIYVNKFLTERYNKKALEIIQNAPYMTIEQIQEAYEFLYNKDVARLIRLNLWDSATDVILVREKILERLNN